MRPVSARLGLSLSVTARLDDGRVSFVGEHVRSAHAILRPALQDLSLALVGVRRMAALHERFMGIPGPTDVLTFPLEHDDAGHVTSGEVVVCVPEARRQAKARGIPVERELLLYALHGLLHLCGYDDRTDASFATMHRTEDRILTQLGVGPVFNTAAAPSAPRRTIRNRLGRRANRAKSSATGAD